MGVNQLKLLIEKPFFDWAEEDKINLPSILKELINSGISLIILGRDRCFFCGNPIYQDIEKVSKFGMRENKIGKGMVVTNLCMNCSKLAEKGLR